MPSEWPLCEVFIRGQHGLNHRHVGSLHAPDAEMAIKHARDVYTRRNEGVSIWVVKSNANQLQLGQLIKPAPDLDRDGHGNLVWWFQNNTPIVAFSGRDGSVLWSYVPELEGPGGPFREPQVALLTYW